MSTPKQDRAREFVAADIDDAIRELNDAVALLPETGLWSARLAAVLRRATDQAKKAQVEFARAADQDGGDRG